MEEGSPGSREVQFADHRLPLFLRGALRLRPTAGGISPRGPGHRHLSPEVRVKGQAPRWVVHAVLLLQMRRAGGGKMRRLS